ncbi:hypothetical protein EZS27_001496 [termite gut metagenome]|uniref:Uncharacterized protein n=1 Tax=termite gut metagenome TaxID=433724 RepID=A0A5J4T144_9ZZZZ
MKKLFRLIPILIMGILISCNEKEDINDEIIGISLVTRSNVSVESVPIVPYFKLTKNNTSKAVNYVFKDGKWETDNSPFLKGEAANGSIFKAEYIPNEVDLITREKDILVATFIYNGEQNIELDFKHINAKLNITLVNNVTKTSDKVNIKLWNIYTINNFHNTSLIISPLIVSKNSEINVVIDGESFTFKELQELTINPNDEINYTLNLNNEVPITFKKSEWSVMDKKLNYVSVYPKISFGSELPSLKGDFIIQINEFKYNYNFNNLNEIIPAGEPYLYWEFFEKGNYNVKGTYIPPYEYDKNYENDILEQNLLSVPWGEDLFFNKLGHINTLISVNLIKGKGFYEGEWETANPLIKGRGIYSVKSSDDIILEQNKPVIIKPILLNDNCKFIINFLEKELIVKLNSIIFNNQPLTELKANTSYVFDLTIDRAGTTNINIIYSDTWNVYNTKGTIVY